MNTKIDKLFKSSFIRNVFIIAFGTASAQIITMFSSPLITRIYGPDVYGIQGTFLAIVAIISPVAALTYPIAIVLPQNVNKAKALVKLSLVISGIIAMILFVILYLFHDYIVKIFNLSLIENYLYLIPIVVLFSAGLQISQQWVIRTKQYKLTAKVSLWHSTIINAAKIGFGLITPSAVNLIFITTIGSALQTVMLSFGIFNRSVITTLKKVSKVKIRDVMYEYIDFPLYRSPQILINSISQSLPIILLTSFFGPISAGYYTLSKNVLSLPIQLIGKSIGDVLYPKLVEKDITNNDIKRLIVTPTLWLFFIGAIPFSIIFAFGPSLFGLIFGQNWYAAGGYASWLSLWIFSMLINKPSVVAIPVLKIQGQFLVFEIVSVILKITALYLGFVVYQSDFYAIKYFSIIGLSLNIFLILYTVLVANKLDKVLSNE